MAESESTWKSSTRASRTGLPSADRSTVPVAERGALSGKGDCDIHVAGENKASKAKSRKKPAVLIKHFPYENDIC